jgi:hypothetical protein
MDCSHESRLQGIFLVPPVIFDVWHLGQFPSSATDYRNFVYGGLRQLLSWTLSVAGQRLSGVNGLSLIHGHKS